jgi:hypothetical protein
MYSPLQAIHRDAAIMARVMQSTLSARQCSVNQCQGVRAYSVACVTAGMQLAFVRPRRCCFR